MIATDHTTLRLSGALNVEHLTALELHIGVNAHGWAIVEGEAGEDALEQLTGAVAGREQHILTIDESGMEKCLFAGVIREASLVSVDGYSRFHVELLSGTCLMDREIRSRSFQDVGRTYSQVAEQVCSEYNGGAAICTVGEDKILGRPVIQYRETDWKFLMRLASHCGGVLVPETHRGLPRLWFGFPDRSFTCEFPEDSYTSGISQRYYELGGMAAGYDRADFFYYDVKSTQLCDLGWYTVFKGQSFIISEKYAVLERGELIFTYRLGRPGLGWGKMLYNEKISGMTLLGEVLETARETVKLKLDIDQDWNPGGPYPYTWRPETGNFMYCMPQVGTRISLYCPNYDEKEAIAVNCVRTNGASCGRMSDPAKRSFVTEHGKEMNLYPEEMSLLGGSEGTVHLSDENGITISSQKPIFILGMSIRFEAPTFRITVPNSELLMAKYQYENQTPDSCYQMTNLFNVLAMNHTHMEGWNRVAYPAFQDAPVEGDFWGSLIGNVLAGLAVVGMVALTLATFGAAAPVVIGAIAVGSMAVIGKGVSDYMSGSVSSTEAYMSAGFWGAVAGAVSGGVGSMIEGAIPEGWALLAKMGVVGGSGVLETWIENTIQGQETTLFDAGLAFVMSAGFYGLGDNLARAFKKWKNATGQADDVARAIAGQTDNVLDNMVGQVDNILDDVTKQMDDVASGFVNQADDLLGDITKNADNLTDDASLAVVKQVDDTLPSAPPDADLRPKDPPTRVQAELADDEVERFYLEVFEQQEANYPEYEQFLDDLLKVQKEAEIQQMMEAAAEAKVRDIIENQSKKEAGPVLSEIFDPETGALAFGQNFKKTATGFSQYEQWLKNDADPLIKELVAGYKEKIDLGEIILPEGTDLRLAGHSEIVALDKILSYRRSLGLPVDQTTISQLYLKNAYLTVAYKTGNVVPKVRCPNCLYLTDGIGIFDDI